MGKSLYQTSKEAQEAYGTTDNTYDDFPIGTDVKIITLCQDFHFFYGETGKVISNEGRYLSIIVEYDEPRKYEDGTIEKTFNFNPSDLAWFDRKKNKAIHREDMLTEIDKAKRSERFDIMDL